MSPLAGLTKLESLGLSENLIVDVGPLENLTNLRWLSLALNKKIMDVTPLTDLTNLTSLQLQGNSIVDVSPLENLTNLIYLRLQVNQIVDLAPLENLTALETLYLDRNQIIDVSPLGNLINITELRLYSNHITDVSPLANLTKFEGILLLSDNEIVDVSPLENLTELEKLTLDDNQIIDVSPLASLTNLTDLYLTNNQIHDVSPLSDLYNLRELRLSGNPIQDTSPIVELQAKQRAMLLPEVIVDIDLVALPVKGQEDVNGDDVVNIQDLVLVASHFGETGQSVADVNSDGVVNIADLVLVAGALGDGAGAPSIHPEALEMFTTTDVQQWLRQAQQLALTDETSRRGILFLTHLLAVLVPEETSLLPNYPNPFNPETWIPYQLSEPAEVTISIYSADGKLVRTLTLGYQPAGIYRNRHLAAYWNGKNALGESIASGVYFYTLTAGKFTATRKMVIWK